MEIKSNRWGSGFVFWGVFYFVGGGGGGRAVRISIHKKMLYRGKYLLIFKRYDILCRTTRVTVTSAQVFLMLVTLSDKLTCIVKTWDMYIKRQFGADLNLGRRIYHGPGQKKKWTDKNVYSVIVDGGINGQGI